MRSCSKRQKFHHGTTQGSSVQRFLYSLLTITFLATLSACGGGGSGDEAPPNDDPVNGSDIPEPVVDEPVIEGPEIGEPVVDVNDPTQCNAATQKQWAYDAMRDYYLFADQVAVVDPQVYESAADLVRQLRFSERDPFSNVSNATTSSLQFDEGREFGVGYSWRYDNEDNARIIEVVGGSPFDLAGIERGDIILTVDGLQWDDQVLFETFDDRVIGTPDNPATSTWQIEKRNTGETVVLQITSAEYAIDTVAEAFVYTNSAFDGTIGYLLFSRFLNTSRQELERTARFFREEQVTELILDLRYNGGGRISIARQLATLIGGSQVSGKTIYSYQYNDRYSDENFNFSFEETEQEGFSRIIFLTTSRTASASEIVIAGLQPYIEVITIGETTRGKPYISTGVDRCDERLNIIEAEGFNAAGNSVFGGIAPTCFAADDLSSNFGIDLATGQVEGFLKAALDYVTDGTCNTTPIASTNSGLERTATYLHDDTSRQGVNRQAGAFVD